MPRASADALQKRTVSESDSSCFIPARHVVVVLSSYGCQKALRGSAGCDVFTGFKPPPPSNKLDGLPYHVGTWGSLLVKALFY